MVLGEGQTLGSCGTASSPLLIPNQLAMRSLRVSLTILPLPKPLPSSSLVLFFLDNLQGPKHPTLTPRELLSQL